MCILNLRQSNEEGIRKCLQVLASLSTKDSSKLNDYKIANIQHNIQNVRFIACVSRATSKAEKASWMGVSRNGFVVVLFSFITETFSKQYICSIHGASE